MTWLRRARIRRRQRAEDRRWRRADSTFRKRYAACLDRHGEACETVSCDGAAD